METSESPLEVLSRAATMVQDNSLPDSGAIIERQRKQLPTTRWRQERRCWSKLGECNGRVPKKIDRLEATHYHSCCSGKCECAPTPLDMSTRAKCLGPPPSYAESILAPGYRPSVIACVPSSDDRRTIYSRQDMRSGVVDPVIDEHFRRSLGKDYVSVFSNELSPTDHDNNNQDSVALIGLSVDDHFAKALGDTWLQLQSKDRQKDTDKEARTPAARSSTSPTVTAASSAAPLCTQRAGVLST